MRIQDHVIFSIEAFNRGEKDHALMHACIAIDATACELFSKQRATNQDYKKCIRDYYWLIQPFLGGGLDFNVTKFSHITLDNGYGGQISDPDLADVIYHIFRCNTAHGKEIPLSYQLLPVSDGVTPWRFGVNNTLQMPERIIWALLAVSVFAKVNSSLQSEGDYFLSWGSDILGIGTTKFEIKDHWGEEDVIKSFLAQHPQTYVDIKNLEEFKDKK